jgi:peptidoglycan/LPS O-acetylase OafA/YrhL
MVVIEYFCTCFTLPCRQHFIFILLVLLAGVTYRLVEAPARKHTTKMHQINSERAPAPLVT